ncbi:hypothetical protein SODALDRAFT_321091 [Sodiomyces alkalinus F11]|uniref:DUF7514 domain-containing protein n=1 Tax=Sodiomyces alkalinus (strain CBS 110278 / VKM F-3762 / F11) TaxID=1314773 RepID=A0A3N2PKF5_SODAK|nr:hypothetical protein SODALDRAFT_321091 [Sodiomyces alkalinus F11]ROT35007.1 hypothetical protein SODALDRAFT_321091 [Sodiomyces alkalinus F11]
MATHTAQADSKESIGADTTQNGKKPNPASSTSASASASNAAGSTNPGASPGAGSSNTTSPSPKSAGGYYGYLFEKDKTPTKTLEALLRAIAKYIIANIGDKRTNCLTPAKLAAFYRAVGGDYDSLFHVMPHASISYIWQVTGCQHSLQPIPGNDFDPPSVPALTLRGFVRWESIEILLGPEEHVPFIQYAMKHWKLKHPDTGEPFPPDLPKEAFPLKPDNEVDRWHKQCAEKLRQEATKPDTASSKPSVPADTPPPATDREEPKVKVAYVHVRNPYPESAPRTRPGPPEYAAHTARPVPFSHGVGRVPIQRVRVPPSPERERGPHRHAHGSSSDEHSRNNQRRRSFSDYPSPPPDNSQPAFQPPPQPPPTRPPGDRRRRSPPRHRSGTDSPSDSEREDSPRPVPRRRPSAPSVGVRPPPSIRRMASPPSSQPPSATHSHRSDGRPDEYRKRGFPIPEVIRDKFDKIASVLPNARSPTRSSSGRRSELPPRRSREYASHPRAGRAWSELDSDESDASTTSLERRVRKEMEMQERRRREERERARAERERERDRGRERERVREREREKERERERERDRLEEERDMRKRREVRYLARPQSSRRRTSSHADVDRARDSVWDSEERDFRGDRKSWKERSTSPVTGVGGRRYPVEPIWS